MAAGSHSPTAPLPHHVPQVGQDHEAGDENNDPQHGAGRQDEGLLQGHQPPRQMGPHGDWREIQGLVSKAGWLIGYILSKNTCDSSCGTKVGWQNNQSGGGSYTEKWTQLQDNVERFFFLYQKNF